MASNFINFVTVFLVSTVVFTSAYIPGYPAPYPQPNPYGQPYPYQNMIPYGQPYPMFPYQPQYPMMQQPYPMPGQYPMQYPVYAANSPAIPMPDMSSNPNLYQSIGNAPQGLPVFPSQSDPSQMTFPSQYGNIPVEILDVAGPQGLPNNQYMPYGSNKPTQVLYVKGDDLNENKTDDLVDTDQNVLEVPNKSVKTESIVETKSKQARIVRTIYPESGQVDVEIQTAIPEKTNTVDNSKAIKPKQELYRFG